MAIAINWLRDMSKFNLFTIGYSGFMIKDFINALKNKSIGALIDIRSSPYSFRFKDYNIEHLKCLLNKNKIYYLFLGDKLGARPKDLFLYTNRVADFSKIAKSGSFIDACARVREGLNRFPICLMCAEKDPATCHRAILVTNNFRNIYPEINIFHIHSLSKIESQNNLDRRIMSIYKLEQGDLLKNETERQKEAYLLQEKKIAYHLKN